MRNKLGPPGTSWNHLEQAGTTWNHLEQGGTAVTRWTQQGIDAKSKKFIGRNCACNTIAR